ncbi:hypothetical protein GW17_00032591, partial [Ensete ventricosum]
WDDDGCGECTGEKDKREDDGGGGEEAAGAVVRSQSDREQRQLLGGSKGVLCKIGGCWCQGEEQARRRGGIHCITTHDRLLARGGSWVGGWVGVGVGEHGIPLVHYTV